ncbi:hypothetical protein [Arcobacter sp. L]|uniref:hypothetical protein n=1 Tax=Arcobacter sp. L TaxID=944547 RepID=UPI0002295F6E|nr:hypothetical protein [Arcobacter sp. L]BAK72822.1 hypothetical protein ABLL_0947 [Arcobacter sp. L]
MKTFLIFLFSFIFALKSFAYTEISTSNVMEDYRKGDMSKYKNDDLLPISKEALISRGIISNESQLTRDISTPSNSANIRSSITCSFVGNDWTATVYSINAQSGIVTCMVAKKGDLYNPIGLFDTSYPNLKEAFALDLKKAEEKNKNLIDNADNQFKPLQDSVSSIQSSILNQTGNYLTIPRLLTAAILSDTDIVDVDATKTAGKLQLKDNFVSSYFDSGSNEFVDNKEYILTDAETIFSVYTGLSDVGMIYLILLIAFFGIWGLGSKTLSHLSSKVEEKQNHEKVSPYVTGIVLGILLFFPTGFKEQVSNNGQVVAEYDIMKTKYQDFEKSGYYLFSDWADAAAKVIIDAEINAIIKKSGVGTKEQIIQTSASKTQAEELKNFTRIVTEICENNIYNYDGLIDSDGNHQYSIDPNVAYPTSEKWAYANSKIRSNTSNLYYSVVDGEVKSSGAYNQNVLNKVNGNNPLDNYYPEYSLSSCGKNYYANKENDTKYRNSSDSLDSLANSGNKIPMLQGLIKFQYELYRDFGYLAVLGLPVTKLQTEYIGGLYKTKRSEVLEKLNAEVKEDSMGTHMIMSSIPYMFVPGAGTIFNIVTENSGKIGGAIGGAGGAAAGGGILSWLSGTVGTVAGAAIGSLGGGMLGMWFAYETAKTVLELTPIVGLVVIGLLRFIVIIIKIFTFHFASLFMMPIMFARQNIEAISRFTMKIFATMLELPIFVLAVWLAMTASSLIHSIGDIFGKKIIIGMLENNSLQYKGVDGTPWSFGTVNGEWISKLKIYVFDGFIEIAIAVFSIVIIYKIIVSLHSTLFEVIEVQGSKELDNAIESMKNEATGWGNRI